MSGKTEIVSDADTTDNTEEIEFEPSDEVVGTEQTEYPCEMCNY